MDRGPVDQAVAVRVQAGGQLQMVAGGRGGQGQLGTAEVAPVVGDLDVERAVLGTAAKEQLLLGDRPEMQAEGGIVVVAIEPGLRTAQVLDRRTEGRRRGLSNQDVTWVRPSAFRTLNCEPSASGLKVTNRAPSTGEPFCSSVTE